jgi:hypothetical protein
LELLIKRSSIGIEVHVRRHFVEAQQPLPCRRGSFKNHLALDQIYRDIRRLALACEHVQRIAAGQVWLRMKPPWRNPRDRVGP